MHSLDHADSWWLCKGLWILAHSQWKAVKRFFGRGLMAILQKLLYLTHIEDEKKAKGGEKALYQTLLAHFSRATSSYCERTQYHSHFSNSMYPSTPALQAESWLCLIQAWWSWSPKQWLLGLVTHVWPTRHRLLGVGGQFWEAAYI